MDKDEKSNLEINLNLDTTPILYTDNIFMSVNEDGLSLDFCQRVANTNKVRVVSRVGMSKEHARKFVSKLSGLLEQSEGHIQTGKIHRV